jgi:hypothetical protein
MSALTSRAGQLPEKLSYSHLLSHFAAVITNEVYSEIEVRRQPVPLSLREGMTVLPRSQVSRMPDGRLLPEADRAYPLVGERRIREA